MAVRARIDLLAGLTVVAIGAVGLSDLAGRPPVAHGMAGDPGPSFLPSALLWLLVGLGGYILVTAALRLSGTGAADPPPVGERARGIFVRLAPALMVLSLAAYLWAMPRFGFLPTTLAFLLGWGGAIGHAEAGSARRLWLVPIEAVAITALLLLLFRTGLRVPLP